MANKLKFRINSSLYGEIARPAIYPYGRPMMQK